MSSDSASTFAPTSEHHEPVGCGIAATMPVDDMFEDMAEIDELGDAGPAMTVCDGAALPDFS